ncbi:thiol peroxidase [Campylobacter ureolyticus]|uniref:Thiol peroxidase n=1 Tax=Campylobacter ureolyticus TaxID=827 RepID=A0AAE7EB64_9BACT|nr:thiol peroxidase [Campylobacter ureolyticus]MCR8685333.1 thiol peroxidase [Campylobacter ureolyticus]MDU7071272.1 thiol peroxidase [Campylobacter ureolyticus]QKF85014.1 lipid hydroperoxide peroxidase [Campylobacter ureolyticus]QQY36493.1 thiol peroxidase [Campylobacter ureolyticus]SUX20043.1 thiol peroxidase [Campylobacter ureolyticus]
MSKVTLNGEAVKLVGDELSVGDYASEVELVLADLKTLKVGGSSEKIQVIATVPSLDTGVCAMETKKFNEKMANLKNVNFSVVSMDLPFALGRFCGAENIKNINTLSDFRCKEFGKKYGVLIDSGTLKGLLARAIFVIDKDSKIIYKEVVSEITKEPDYDGVIKALNLGCGPRGC